MSRLFLLGNSRVIAPHCHSSRAFCPKTEPVQRELSYLCKTLHRVVDTCHKPPDLHRIVNVLLLATSLVVSKQSIRTKETLVIVSYQNILGDQFMVLKVH